MSDQQQPEPQRPTEEQPAAGAPKPPGRRRPGPATFAVAAAASGFAFGAVVFGMARGEAEGSDDGHERRIVRVGDDRDATSGRRLLRQLGGEGDEYEDDEYEDDEYEDDEYEDDEYEDDEYEDDEHEDDEHEDDEHEDDEYEDWMRHELEEGEGEWWEYGPGARAGDDGGYYEPRTSTRGS